MLQHSYTFRSACYLLLLHIETYTANYHSKGLFLNKMGLVDCHNFIWEKAAQNHQITERLRLERTSGDHLVQPPCSSSDTQSQLSRTVQAASECLQGWRLHHFSGEHVPGLGYLHSENVFPDAQREPPLFQFVPIASGLVTGHHWEEPGCIFFTPCLQVFIYIDKIPAEPSPTWMRLDWPLLPCSCCISVLLKGEISLDVFPHAEKEHISSVNRTCLLMCQSSNAICMLEPDITTVVFGEMFSLTVLDGGSPSKNIAMPAIEVFLWCSPDNLSPELVKSELAFFNSKAILTFTTEEALELMQDNSQNSLGLGQLQ